jgi:hypothetical protein
MDIAKAFTSFPPSPQKNKPLPFPQTKHREKKGTIYNFLAVGKS